MGTFKINLFNLATHVFRDRGLLVTPSIYSSSINEPEAYRSQFYKFSQLVSFDVKSLFTNVPIQGAIEAVERALDANPDTQLRGPKRDFIRRVRLCVEFGAFEFEGMKYKQINGLAMGSPLSPILACLFMEMLKADHFLGINRS